MQYYLTGHAHLLLTTCMLGVMFFSILKISHLLKFISMSTTLFLLPLSLLCFLLGLPLNLLALSYFSRRSRARSRDTLSLSDWMYCLISSTDALLSSLMCYVAVLLATKPDATVSSDMTGASSEFVLLATNSSSAYTEDFYCIAFTWLWNITSRLSIFTMCLLSVVRAVSIYNPFKSISSRLILVLLFLQIAYLVLFELSPGFRGMKLYYSYAGVCDWTVEGVVNKTPFHVTYTSMYFLPMLTTIASSLFSTLILRRNSTKFTELTQTESRTYCNKMAAAKTIFIMVILYVICNVPHFLVLLLYTITMVTGLDVFGGVPETRMKVVQTVCSCYLVAVNALLNPLVYIVRIKDYRGYVGRLLGSIRWLGR